MEPKKRSAFEIDHKRDENLKGITLKEFLMSKPVEEIKAYLYNRDTGERILDLGSPVDIWRGNHPFLTLEQRLIQKVYQVASRLDMVVADQLNGKEGALIGGEEYEALMDVLIEAEDYMQKNNIKF